MIDADIKKRILRSLVIVLALLGVLMLYIGYISVWCAEDLANNPFNLRKTSIQSEVRRGTILDVNGEILAKTDNNGERIYPLAEVASTVVGYIGKNIGSDGIEQAENKELLGATADIGRLGPIAQLFQADKGNDIRLTIDIKAQQAAYDALASHKGAAVVLDAETGAVLAMVNTPTYNPNDIEKNWGIIKNSADSPLLNRATRGMYPPGSTIKPVIADIALQDAATDEQEIFNCTGKLDLGGGAFIGESHGEVHNKVNLGQAIIESCNVTFGSLGIRLGAKNLSQGFERFGLTKPIEGEISVGAANLPDFTRLAAGELAQLAIGQGELLVTPIHMALIASAFANNGVIMKPYLVQQITRPDGVVVQNAAIAKWQTATTPAMAAKINNYMADVVSKGTGTRAKIAGVNITGKTGTAENSQGSDHAWFIGTAEVKNRHIALAVIVENGGAGGIVAAPIAKSIIASLL